MLSKKNSKKTIKSIITLTTFTLFSAPLFAQAEECTMNADCAEGEYCEMLEAPLVQCSIDEEGNEDCGEIVDEDPVGFCQERPIECETDSDCPSHLSCGWGIHEGGVEPVEGESAGSSSGGAPIDRSADEESSSEFPEEAPPEPPTDDEPDVDEPTEPVEDEPMMCVFVPTECESDDQCAMNFHCETYSVGVSCGETVQVPCQEGEECPPVAEPDCEDEEYTEGYCVPNEIDCNSDDMCPADWRCREIVETDCGDTDQPIPQPADFEDSSSSDPEQAPEEQAERMPPQMIECEETVRSLCVPVGLSDSGLNVYGEVEPAQETGLNGEPRDETDQEEGGEADDQAADDTDAPEEGSSDEVSEDSGGCDAKHTAPTAWALLALLGTLGLRRRYV